MNICSAPPQLCPSEIARDISKVSLLRAPIHLRARLIASNSLAPPPMVPKVVPSGSTIIFAWLRGVDPSLFVIVTMAKARLPRSNSAAFSNRFTIDSFGSLRSANFSIGYNTSSVHGTAKQCIVPSSPLIRQGLDQIGTGLLVDGVALVAAYHSRSITTLLEDTFGDLEQSSVYTWRDHCRSITCDHTIPGAEIHDPIIQPFTQCLHPHERNHSSSLSGNHRISHRMYFQW